jgi:hypothetical protein
MLGKRKYSGENAYIVNSTYINLYIRLCIYLWKVIKDVEISRKSLSRKKKFLSEIFE